MRIKLQERTCPGLSYASRLQYFPRFPSLTKHLLRKYSPRLRVETSHFSKHPSLAAFPDDWSCCSGGLADPSPCGAGVPSSRGQAGSLRGGREGRGWRCAGTASPYSHIPLHFSSSRPCRRSTPGRGCRRSAYEKNRPLSASRRPAPPPAAGASTPPALAEPV